jgi:hypothetical protein
MRRIRLDADEILVFVAVYLALVEGSHRLHGHFPVLAQASVKVHVTNKDHSFCYGVYRIRRQALSGYSQCSRNRGFERVGEIGACLASCFCDRLLCFEPPRSLFTWTIPLTWTTLFTIRT